MLSLYRPDEDQYSKFVDNYQVFLKILVDFLFFSQRPLKNLFVAQYMKNLFFSCIENFSRNTKRMFYKCFLLNINKAWHHIHLISVSTSWRWKQESGRQFSTFQNKVVDIFRKNKLRSFLRKKLSTFFRNTMRML